MAFPLVGMVGPAWGGNQDGNPGCRGCAELQTRPCDCAREVAEPGDDKQGKLVTLAHSLSLPGTAQLLQAEGKEEEAKFP